LRRGGREARGEEEAPVRVISVVVTAVYAF
jgi:hypothetical protein